jgi:uncharacterized membrane protein YfhO|tara:strand:- start:587 stop:2713 length:2127 start_codon:yes stop_codon:yes gene_type:complete
MFLFLKKIRISEFGSLVGSIVYLLSGRFAISLWVGLPNYAPWVMLTPLVFLLIENFFEKKNLRYALYVSIPLALIILGAHAQYFFFTIFIVSLYFIFRLVTLIKERVNIRVIFKLIFYIALIFVFMTSLSAIQLLPSLEFSKNSIRLQDFTFEFASSISYEPWTLITLAIPNFFGSYLDNTYWGSYAFWQKNIYIGILPLIFVFFSLFCPKNKHYLFFLFLLVFSFLFALGKYFPLYYLFYNLPLFNLFRAPTRILFFFNFSMIVLAAFGVDFLFYKVKEKYVNRKLIKKIIGIFIVLSLIITLSTLSVFLFKGSILNIGENILDRKFDFEQEGLNSYDFYSSKIEAAYNKIFFGLISLSIFFGLGVLLVLYLYKGKYNINRKYIKFIIILIICLDLGLYSSNFIDVKDSKEIFSTNKFIDYLLQDNGHFRILDTTTHTLPQHLTMRNSIYKINGYDGMIRVDYQNFVSAGSGIELKPTTIISLKNITASIIYDMLNVKYIISNDILNGKQYKRIKNITTYLYVNNADYSIFDKKIFEAGYEAVSEQDTYIYLNLNAFPKAFVVPNAIVFDNKEKILDAIVDNQLDFKDSVILEQNTNKPLTNKGSFKEAKINLYSPNKVIATVNLKTPGYLVLADTFDKGWKAYDNGKETKVFRANYILRGVYLEKGNHEVIFKYEPGSYKLGRIISIISLSIILLIVFLKRPNLRK